MTSSEVTWNSIGVSFGRYSWVDSMPPNCGYRYVHHHCWPITWTWSMSLLPGVQLVVIAPESRQMGFGPSPPRSGRHDQLVGAEREYPQHDGRGTEDPAHLDGDPAPGVPVDRRAVLVIPGPPPPDHERVDEVEQDERHDRPGGDGQHRDVELLARRHVGHPARGQMG